VFFNPDPSYGFLILPKKRFRTVTDKNVHEVKFGNFAIKTVQVCQAYDSKRKYHSGFLLTPITEKEIRKGAGKSGRGNLYIKGWDRSKGLWEITFPDTRLKQIEEDLIWFHSNGTSGFKVLKPITRSNVDDE
jgi:hypothetical protein